MSELLQELIAEQEFIYGRIVKARENFKNLTSEKLTMGHVKTRIESLQEYWSRFFANYITITRQIKPEDRDAFDYLKTDIFFECEELYIELKADMIDVREQLQEETNTESQVKSQSFHRESVAKPELCEQRHSSSQSKEFTSEKYSSERSHHTLLRREYSTPYQSTELENELKSIFVNKKEYMNDIEKRKKSEHTEQRNLEMRRNFKSEYKRKRRDFKPEYKRDEREREIDEIHGDRALFGIHERDELNRMPNKLEFREIEIEKHTLEETNKELYKKRVIKEENNGEIASHTWRSIEKILCDKKKSERHSEGKSRRSSNMIFRHAFIILDTQYNIPILRICLWKPWQSRFLKRVKEKWK